MGIGRLCALEGGLDMTKIMGHGMTVEMVDDIALATGGGTLHLHHTIAHIEGRDLPTGCRHLLQLQSQGFL